MRVFEYYRGHNFGDAGRKTPRGFPALYGIKGQRLIIPGIAALKKQLDNSGWERVPAPRGVLRWRARHTHYAPGKAYDHPWDEYVEIVADIFGARPNLPRDIERPVPQVEPHRFNRWDGFRWVSDE